MPDKSIMLGNNTLPIKEFDLNTMVANPSICMIAKRGSGKSVVCRELLCHFRDIPVGVIIAPTDKMNCYYGKFFPDLYIHYAYDGEILENLMRRQKIMIDKMKEKYRRGKKCNPRAFLVMDDCLSSKGSWMKDEQIMKMFFDGRHYQIMYILTMQFPLGIKPELRTNFDYIFLLADDFYSNKKRLYEHYAGMFPSFDTFRQVFDELTSDYGCMVVVNRGSRKNFLEKIFWYRANITNYIGDIGCKQFNKFHKDNYDNSWRKKEDEREFNVDNFWDKKRTKIHVEKKKVDS